MARGGTAAALLLALVLSPRPAAQAEARQATGPDPASLGPKVGDALPDFTLPDQHGTPRSLKSLLGPNGAVIVFFRSADW